MLLEVSRFQNDVAANPGILASCCKDAVGVSSMVSGARQLGYDFDLKDIEDYYKSDAHRARSIQVKYAIRTEDDEMRDLTDQEIAMVSGGGEVTTYAQADVAVYSMVYAVTRVGIAVQIAAVVGAVIGIGGWAVTVTFTMMIGHLAYD